jgi:hypothetical protein
MPITERPSAVFVALNIGGSVVKLAIGLAVALALDSTMALGGNGAGWLYTNDPANCGGLVCFMKSPVAPTAAGHRPHRRSKPFKHPGDLHRGP